MLNVLAFLSLLLLASGIFAVAVMTLFFLRRKFRELHARLARAEQIIWESAAIHGLMDRGTLLARPGGWAASTDILYELGRLLQLHQPQLVVELGSGLSTLILAKAVSGYGGKVIAVDHDQVFAQQTREELTRHGLQIHAEVRFCPLRDFNDKGASLWYETTPLQDIDDVQFLFVDGPPAAFEAQIRRWALPFFKDRMAKKAIIVFDDTNRAAERQLVEEWHKARPDSEMVDMLAEKGAMKLVLGAKDKAQ